MPERQKPDVRVSLCTLTRGELPWVSLETRSSGGSTGKVVLHDRARPGEPVRRGGDRVEPDLPQGRRRARRPGSTTSPCRPRTSSPPPRTGVRSPRSSPPTARRRPTRRWRSSASSWQAAAWCCTASRSSPTTGRSWWGSGSARGQGRRPLREAVGRSHDDVPRQREQLPRREGRARPHRRMNLIHRSYAAGRSVRRRRRT